MPGEVGGYPVIPALRRQKEIPGASYLARLLWIGELWIELRYPVSMNKVETTQENSSVNLGLQLLPS